MAALVSVPIDCPAGDATIDVPVTTRLAEMQSDVAVFDVDADMSELFAHMRDAHQVDPAPPTV